MSQFAFKCLKYFLLALFGFANTYIISNVFGASIIVQLFVSPSLWQWLFRVAVFIFCFCGVAIIYESSR
jgi:hypothetical protein